MTSSKEKHQDTGLRVTGYDTQVIVANTTSKVAAQPEDKSMQANNPGKQEMRIV